MVNWCLIFRIRQIIMLRQIKLNKWKKTWFDRPHALSDLVPFKQQYIPKFHGRLITNWRSKIPATTTNQLHFLIQGISFKCLSVWKKEGFLEMATSKYQSNLLHNSLSFKQRWCITFSRIHLRCLCCPEMYLQECYMWFCPPTQNRRCNTTEASPPMQHMQLISVTNQVQDISPPIYIAGWQLNAGVEFLAWDRC